MFHDKNSNIWKTTSRGRIFRWWIESLLMVVIRRGFFSSVLSIQNKFSTEFAPWDDAGRFSENWRFQWIKWIKSEINSHSENNKSFLNDWYYWFWFIYSKLELRHHAYVDTRHTHRWHACKRPILLQIKHLHWRVFARIQNLSICADSWVYQIHTWHVTPTPVNLSFFVSTSAAISCTDLSVKRFPCKI